MMSCRRVLRWAVRGRRWAAVAPPFLVGLLAAACSSGGGPRVDGALPSHAAARAQTFLMIEGDGFAAGAQVHVGPAPLQQLTWVNARLLTGIVAGDLQPGSYDVIVENPGSGTATRTRAFTVDGTAPAPAAPAPTNSLPPTAPPNATQSPPPTQRPAEQPTERATQPPTQRPTERPTQQSTRVPTEPPTEPPPTRQPARPTPVQPQNRPQQTPDLSGEWLITDTVTFGAGSGSSFPFDLAISQQGNQISGSGGGLQVSGVVDGASVSASYAESNGTTGSFTWTAGADGNSLAGSFSNSSGNGGDSVGQRIDEGTTLDVQRAPPPADVAPRGGKAKKKGR